MWLKAQNEMAGLLPHAAMGPVERMVRFQLTIVGQAFYQSLFSRGYTLLVRRTYAIYVGITFIG